MMIIPHRLLSAAALRGVIEACITREGTDYGMEVANSCISKIYHTAPGDERPQLAGTFCGIV